MLDAAFLADIAEHPEDDAPRLIYADWLEDHGEPARAEFIRVQVRRATLPEDAWEQRDLAGAEAALLNDHAAAWRGTLPTLPGVAWGEFARGFVSQVLARSASDFLQHAEALFHAAPVRGVKFVEPVEPAVAGQLAASPFLERLTLLNVENGAMPNFRSAQVLLASPHLGQLRVLLLNGNPLGDDVFAPLANARLPRLEELYLGGMGITERGVEQLADRDALGTLVTLDLRDDSLDDASIRAMGRWACAPTLGTLWVVNNRLGAAAAADLSWRFPGLRRLYLGHNAIGDAGAGALARSPLQELRALDVRYGDIRDGGLLALAGSPLAGRLTRLWLAGNPMNHAGTPQELRRLLGPRLAG